MVHPCNKPCGNKTASGYCATTACINPQYSNIGTVYYGQSVQKRIITNADRIRAMTDEELAKWISTLADCCGNDHCGEYCPLHTLCWSKSDESTLDWLKQEAKE